MREIQQGEGGEQGDPLMPAPFAMGQHQALQVVQESLQPTETLMAFLDDVCVLSNPDRISRWKRQWNANSGTMPGFRSTTERRKAFGPPGLQTPPKFHERTPKREKKERQLWREREKNAKFWAVRRRGSGGEGVRQRGARPNLGRTDENLEHTPHRHTPHNTHHTTNTPHTTHLTQHTPHNKHTSHNTPNTTQHNTKTGLASTLLTSLTCSS